MAEWWSIEVFSGDKLSASAWRYAYEDVLTTAAITQGAVYWDWFDSRYGVVFEVCFATDGQWIEFRSRPEVKSALDAVPDPVNGLLVYRGRGGAAGSRKPRKPKPAPGAAALELDEPRERRRIRVRNADAERLLEEVTQADPPGIREEPGEPARLTA